MLYEPHGVRREDREEGIIIEVNPRAKLGLYKRYLPDSYTYTQQHCTKTELQFSA